jgi:hypothetical protein
MERVTVALKRYAPTGIDFVTDRRDAHLVILHVIGYPETETAVQHLRAGGQSFALIQYCMRSTQKPSTRDWLEIWRGANLVWSYYDIPKLMEADNVFDPSINFYCSPLGVDPVFTDRKLQEVKTFTMLTSGFVVESESIAECEAAVQRVGGRQFHLGPRDACPTAELAGVGVGDPTLADAYTRSAWVAGLRRAEGFEMPAAEGLCCGARPIMFDAPHYRRWFEPWAQFIPEGTFDEVADAITDIFRQGCVLVTEAEQKAAIERFNWKTIVEGFWEGVLQ